FYEHKGISIWGIFRGVVWQTIRGKKAQGGSTLTQQFIKNSILTSERTITRKIKEWLLAYRLENRFSKDEILQMYFNEIPYGSTAYGVEAASQKYFGKTVKDINLAEAAILAALPQGPSRYSPYGSNIDLLLGRQRYILDLMVDQGHATEEEAEEAKNYELTFSPPTANIKAPHFVMYVKEILSSKYGEKMVEQGGLKIITTLDLYKQEIAEEVVKEQAEKNLKNFNATNAALVAINPKNGQILCMVGSKDYFDQEIDGQVNITTSKRQPGSSLKPLVYAAAFIKGYTPNTILYDVITNFSNDATKPYEPRNYDSAEHGPVSIRKALAGSLNVPAVKAIYLAGIKNVTNLAFDLGYTTLSDPDRFGLSLVLGGGEVKLIEHANAYSAFAREGVLHPVSAILRVEKPDGTVLEEFQENEKKVLDPKIARQINDVLSDNGARAYIFGERNWLTLGTRPVAAKTGTTNDYRDAWTMGYTPSIVAGVWVGNNDNSEMKRGADGGVVAAPIWHNFMEKVLGDTPIEKFKPAEIPTTGKAMLDGQVDTGNIVKIDKISGLLATEYTPAHLIIEKS
ncbi:MAG TPA: transglycosylase domain-containing protein, partial [Patescibacteria group bacterium]|nr:transglycosylase domain-containing protein [Patescibacteria group bacterium]